MDFTQVYKQCAAAAAAAWELLMELLMELAGRGSIGRNTQRKSLKARLATLYATGDVYSFSLTNQSALLKPCDYCNY